jgi:hypothetical protein
MAVEKEREGEKKCTAVLFLKTSHAPSDESSIMSFIFYFICLVCTRGFTMYKTRTKFDNYNTGHL